MISVRKIIVKSAILPMLLLCDVIGNIQHLPTGRSNRQSHLQSALLPTIIQIFCMKFCMDDPHDLINHTHDEKKKCLATVTTFFEIVRVCYGQPYYII